MFSKKPFTYSPIDVKCKKETANKKKHPPKLNLVLPFSISIENYSDSESADRRVSFKSAVREKQKKIGGWVQRKRMWHLQLSATPHCRVAKENQRQKDEVASSYCSQLSAAPPS